MGFGLNTRDRGRGLFPRALCGSRPPRPSSSPSPAKQLLFTARKKPVTTSKGCGTTGKGGANKRGWFRAQTLAESPLQNARQRRTPGPPLPLFLHVTLLSTRTVTPPPPLNLLSFSCRLSCFSRCWGCSVSLRARPARRGGGGLQTSAGQLGGIGDWAPRQDGSVGCYWVGWWVLVHGVVGRDARASPVPRGATKSLLFVGCLTILCVAPRVGRKKGFQQQLTGGDTSASLQCMQTNCLFLCLFYAVFFFFELVPRDT